MDRRIGEAHNFGADGAVTSTFNGLRFMHKQLEGSLEPFATTPYTDLVQKLGKVETDLSLFSSTISHDEIGKQSMT
jgi:hypothetical protein